MRGEQAPTGREMTPYRGDERGPGNLIQVADAVSGRVIDEIEVDGCERLHGPAFLPGDSLFALTWGRTGEVLILGLGDGQMRRSLDTGGRASHMLALGGDWIYTANLCDGTVSRIDPAGENDPDVWPAWTRTEGMAATTDGATVVVSDNGLSGGTSPQGFAQSRDGRWASVSTKGIDRVALVDLDAAQVVAFIESPARPDGIAVSPVSGG